MIAFWLMPAAEEARFFTSLLQRLATDHNAPRFEAHLTLHAGAIDAEEAVAAAREIEVPSRLVLAIDRIAHSAAFTQTVFVQLHPTAELRALSEALRARVPGGSGYAFNPHLSLIYKTMPAATRAAIADTVTLPFERIAFDCLKVITGHDRAETGDDVESWRTIAERQLSC